MSVEIGRAIRNGVDNVASKNGAIFIAALTAAYLLYDIASDTILAGVGEPQTGLAIGSSIGLGVSLLAVYIVSMLYITLVLLRTFVAGEKNGIPESMYKKNLLLPGLNFVVGSIIFTLLVGLGLLLFVIPGIFLLVALYFYSFEIAVQDKNFVQAIKRSYSLTKGNRVELFALGAIVVLISLIIGAVTLPFLVVAQFGGTAVTLVSMAVYNLALATMLVVSFSIAAQAYNQLLEIEKK